MERTIIAFKDDGIYGQVRLFSADKIAGKMDVSLEDGKFRVFHTEVDPIYQGRGFAKLLLNQLVSFARTNNLRVIPRCPYVLGQFKRYPKEYADIW